MLAAVHAVADRVQPPENAKAMLLGIAAVMIERNLGDGDDPGADEINQIWEAGFGWRMVRLSS